jgi:stage IV sporulation protein FB
MMERGYLTLFRVRGVPLRAHWTLPIGALLFSGGRFAPGTWLGVLAIILLHELGHAFVVNRVGLVNLGIDVTGFGGATRWAGHPTPRQRALVAWGGVFAQLIVLAIVAPIVWLAGPFGGFLGDLAYAFTYSNVFIMAFNLIPIRPFDGAEAWPLLPHLFRDWRRTRRWKKKLTVSQALRDLDQN